MSTILLLDDDTRFRKLVAALLQRRTHEVIQAATGAEAREAVSSGRVDLAIVDFRLPDIDGISWITWLRESGVAMPVIFLSGFSCDNRMLNLLRNVLSVPIVLKKPLEPASFVGLVDRQLRDSSERLKKWLSQPTDGSGQQYSREPNLVDEMEGNGDEAVDPALEQRAVDVETRQTGRVFYMRDSILRKEKAAAIKDGRSVEEPSLDLDLLRELTVEYLNELPSQLLKLADDINDAASGGGESALATAICESHRLRGTSGSYGFMEVSEMMGVIEDTLIEIVRLEDSSAKATMWCRVESAILQAMASAIKSSAA